MKNQKPNRANRWKNLPRVLSFASAAREFKTTPQRLTDLATRKRGVVARKGPHKGKLIQLKRWFCRIGKTKFPLIDETELRRAKRAGVL
jgi:hypothetical protein